ncbi:hypothetical protein I302_107400 [Kwoniella bestiolae CBS 10118]|uniref:Uncharacterized protein n=1 Tax=Kwoniella bestiolae CBS 10118 TaxID=1296100 RepID=A0A1B9FYM8_9TREE|nr:hypothetical protein I302_06862 [Kwoniella bestiolae CBS 10118]OCF23876.1 hypothetical protein I302_06862 [Kwoniella bestiolae CBS 10118]
MPTDLVGLEDLHSAGIGSSRRRSSTSSSSSSWSPPDTPTPIHNAPLNGKAILQPGRIPRDGQFSFSVPIVKRPTKRVVSGSLFRNYRVSITEDDEDTELDDEDDLEVGTVLSDVESDLNPHTNSENGSGNGTVEAEGDEVDMFLVSNVPSSPAVSPAGWSDRKGKKRLREYEYDYDERMEDGDGDDKMETEGLLSVKQRGKRAVKYPRQISAYPNEKSSALGTNYSVVGNICDKMGGLHASSTILAMNVDIPLHPTYDPTREKNPDLSAYQMASEKTGAGVGHNIIKSRTKKLTKKRGQTKKCFQMLTASEDPLVYLPAFQNWKPSNIKIKSRVVSSSSSAMDISEEEQDEEDQLLVDQEMKSLSDIECTAGGISSDVDMKSVSSVSTLKTKKSSPATVKIRKLYEPSSPLAKSQIPSPHSLALKRDVYRRSRLHGRVERLPGQHSTSHLRRSSPSSLLPARRYMTRSHRPPIVTHKYRSKPGKVDIGACLPGHTFISILRAKLSSRKERRQVMAKYNAQTKDGQWRKMIGNWWGHKEVRGMTDKWWLPDEVEVEALLPPVIPSEDEIMLSPPSSPQTLHQARKRVVEEATDDLTIGDEVSERWARRNQLRREELQPYVAQLKAQEEARKSEQRRARAEVIRRRLAEIAEQRRMEEAERRESMRLVEEERRRSEEIRAEQAREREREEQDRIALALAQAQQESQIIPTPPSPVQSETSTSTVLSDPPEYEFPSYPIALSRSSRLNPNQPVPRVRRVISDVLPEYLPDRWNNRSPPPPPPYNARTDCQTLIAPVFIEDSDDEEDEDEDEDVGMTSPMVPSRRTAREASPEPRVIGSFPSRQLFVPTPIRVREVIDPIRAFENALDLEEGVEEANDVEGHLDASMEEDEEEEDVVPGGMVAGVFQRVFGMVWGGAGRR